MNRKAQKHETLYIASTLEQLPSLFKEMTLTLVQGHSDLGVQKSSKIFLSEPTIARNKKPAYTLPVDLGLPSLFKWLTLTLAQGHS